MTRKATHARTHLKDAASLWLLGQVRLVHAQVGRGHVEVRVVSAPETAGGGLLNRKLHRLQTHAWGEGSGSYNLTDTHITLHITSFSRCSQGHSPRGK